MPISGHKAQYGVDTSVNPILIPDRVYSTDSVNRAYRGGLNRTRPPFRPIKLFFRSDSDREKFEKGNVTGVYGYTGMFPYTASHIVVTCGKCVFAGQIMNGSISFTIIWDQLNPYWANNYFCQAENILVISNGKDDPIFWDGQTDRMRYCKDSSWVSAPMPKFNAMVYAHGRIFGATENGSVFVGDHLYSQGINASSEAVLNFNESTYPSSGDGFTAPASWGDLTGISVVQRNPSANGHGEVIVFHLLGAYSINANLPRNQWTSEQVQQTVFTGIGGASPESIVTINNDIYFRCSNRSIASLRETISDFTNQISIRPLSQEVDRYLSFDNFNQLRYSMAGISQNRALFTVNHTLERDDNDQDIHHRLAEGMVVLDLHRGSASFADSRSWDGLWTGPRVTGIASLAIGKERDCYFCSRDSDKVNRIYQLSKFSGNDIVIDSNTGHEAIRPIKSFYTFESVFDGLAASANDIALTTISNSVLFYSDSHGISELNSTFSSNYSNKWVELYSDAEIGTEIPADSVIYSTGNGRHVSESISSVDENDGSVHFRVRTEINGSVSIHGNFLVSSSIDKMDYSYTSSCSVDSESTNDNINYFDNLF